MKSDKNCLKILISKCSNHDKKMHFSGIYNAQIPYKTTEICFPSIDALHNHAL